MLEPILLVSILVTVGMLLSVITSECHPNGFVSEIRPVQVQQCYNLFWPKFQTHIEQDADNSLAQYI